MSEQVVEYLVLHDADMSHKDKLNFSAVHYVLGCLGLAFQGVRVDVCVDVCVQTRVWACV